MPAAAQFMWDQVATTDFDQRVSLLAEEAAAAQPDVIGLQEATIWSCRPKPWSAPVPVFDFTTQFLEATAEAGVEYKVAERGGITAQNPGYEIPSIPFLTTVEDPDTFQPLFGTDTADCGFVIGDTLLVRADIAKDVLAVGTGEYDDRYAVAPVVFTIDRGYAWADIAIAGTTIRAVTTHLESLWAPMARSPQPSRPANSWPTCRPRRSRPSSSGTSTPTLATPGSRVAENPGEQPEAGASAPPSRNRSRPRTPTPRAAPTGRWWTPDTPTPAPIPWTRSSGPGVPTATWRVQSRAPEGIPGAGQRCGLHRPPRLRVHPERGDARASGGLRQQVA